MPPTPTARVTMNRRRVKKTVARLSAIARLAALLFHANGCAANTQPIAPTTKATRTSHVSSPTVTRGRELYEADGCSDCHSLDGTRMTGPSWEGLAGSRVTLSDGRTVTADDAYLTRHIIEPNALTVQGYPGEVMAQAIETFDLKRKPEDVRALVAFIDSVR